MTNKTTKPTAKLKGLYRIKIGTSGRYIRAVHQRPKWKNYVISRVMKTTYFRGL